MRPTDISLVLDQEFQSLNHAQHTPVMLWGPPGVGKSQIVASIAKKHQVPLIDIRLSQIEPSDLRGIPFRAEHGVEWATPNMLPNEKKHGPAGILFLDEINAAPPSIAAAAYQLILDRRIGDYSMPDGWAIFAAGNRQGDRGVTYSMPSPLANRFSHYELEVHLDDWVSWAYQQKLDERIIAFLRFRPELLFDFDPMENPLAFPSPRSWEFAHRALKKFEQYPQLLTAGLQACVGEVAGLEASAFIDCYQKIPDVDAIISGETVDVPDTIDLQYAVAAALVSRAIGKKQSPDLPQVLGNILNYAKQFPQKEMGVMLVSDLQRAIGSAIFQVAEFSPWANIVADIMFYHE